MSALRSEIRALSRLAWPVVLTQMAMMMLGLVDTRMVGHLGSVELSAVGLADAIMFGSLILGMGLVLGIDPIVSQAHGAGEGKLAGLALQRGIVLGVVASIPLTLVWLHTEEILLLLRQDRQLASLAQVYADAQMFSIAPVLVFMAMRQYMQGRGDVITPLWVAILANPLNVLFNWALIFGHLGLPAMGVTGAGLATGFSRVFMVVALAALLFGRGKHRGAWTPWSRDSFSWSGQRQVLRYGIPVGAQYGLEVWAFSCSNLMAGLLMHPAVAAHIIVLKLASFTFMVPVGISHAGSVRVGNLLGARDRPGAQRAAWVALAMGGGVMLFAALTLHRRREGDHPLPRDLPHRGRLPALRRYPVSRRRHPARHGQPAPRRSRQPGRLLPARDSDGLVARLRARPRPARRLVGIRRRPCGDRHPAGRLDRGARSLFGAPSRDQPPLAARA
jgi:MATE family multidrug resistance protein